jgi:hypothetical protein
VSPQRDQNTPRFAAAVKIFSDLAAFRKTALHSEFGMGSIADAFETAVRITAAAIETIA